MTQKASTSRRFTPTKGTLVALLMASMLNCMGGAAVAPALPQISAAFPESPETMIAFVVSLPALAVAISGLFVGALADRIGKAKTLVIFLIVFTVSGLSGIVMPNLELLLVSRFILGIGIAGVSTATTALIADYYDSKDQARVLGLQSAAAGVSIMTLETTGGFLALGGWRIPFVVYAIGIPMIICALLFVREAYDPKENRKASKAAKSKRSHKPSADDGQQASSDNAPANDTTAHRGIVRAVQGTGIVVALCLTFAFFNQAVAFLGPSKMPYLVAQFGGSTALAGIFLGISGLANILASLAYAPLVRRLGRFWLVSIGFSITVIGCLFTAFAVSEWSLLIGIVLVNGAVAFVLPLTANWLAWVATPQTSGKLMGANTMLINLGQFFCPLWSGIVLAQTDSYSAVYLVAAGMALAMVAIAVIGRIVRPRLQNLQSTR